MIEHGRDAVLVVGFGGPERPEEIRPFLQHVLRGRPVPASRIETVAHHYEAIGGRSPINEWTQAQCEALRARLLEHGHELSVRTGMRHAKPFIASTLRELSQAHVQRIVAVVMASFHDRSTLERYASAVNEAKLEAQCPELVVEYTDGPDELPGFVTANEQHVRAAYARIAASQRGGARLVFTAHSVPTAVGEASGYVARFESAAKRIAAALGNNDYRLAYQSRSGAPSERWLEPDICAVIEEEAARGTKALVVAPIGFVCDHVEVLYDLDIEARQRAQDRGIELARAATVGTHPAYIDALAQTVLARLGQA
jgi:ferrochelatase